MPQDLLDQIADQQAPQSAPQPALQPQAAPQPQAAAPPQPTAKPAPQGDLLDQVADQGKTEQPGMFDAVKGYWDWTNKKLDTSLLSPMKEGLAKEDEVGQKIIDHEIAQAHPYRAALAQFYYGSMKDIGNLGLQLTTPKQLALQAAGGLQARAAKAGLTLANLYFAYRGAQELFDEREAGESRADDLQRRLYGASAVAFGAAGAGADVKDIARTTAQKGFGLSGDLQSRVSAKVAEAQAVRARGVQAAQQEQAATQQRVSGIQQAGAQDVASAQAALTGAKEQIPKRMGQVLADTVQAAHIEKARVEQPFHEMAEMASDPVDNAASLRASVTDTIESHGVQPHEIPASIFNALVDKGMPDLPAGMRLTERTAPGTPAYDRMVERGIIDGDNQPVSFSDLTRMRNDLWDAAQSSKDGTIKAAMFDALDSVTKMQEDYAEQNGFGAKYQAAKKDYMKFKRELGSGLVNDFIKARDYQEQQMSRRVSQLMSPSEGEALRGLLRIAGVDIKPLDDLIGQRSDLTARLRQIPKETATSVRAAQREGAANVRSIGKGVERDVRDLGKRNSIVSGVNDFEFQGLGNQQIRVEAMQRLANNMRSQGIGNPIGYVMLTVGLLRMVSGSPFGMFSAGYGGARIAASKIPSLVRNPAFQDWVIRESGVEPSNKLLIRKMRVGLENWYPVLRRAAASGSASRLATQAGNTQQESAQP